MANLSNVGLNPDVEAAGDGFEVLPQGEYTVVITNDEVKDNKKGNGKLIVLDMKVVEGQYTGSNLKDHINLTNPNQDAAKIGQGVLKKVCELCGVAYPPADTTALYGKKMNVKVVVDSFTSNTSGNELKSNTIKAYKKAQSVSGPVPLPTEPPAQTGGW